MWLTIVGGTVLCVGMEVREKIHSEYWDAIAAPLLLKLADSLALHRPDEPVAHLQDLLACTAEPGRTGTDRLEESDDSDDRDPPAGSGADSHHARSALVLHSIAPVNRSLARVNLAYSPALLHSWTPQPSPCCAGASLAGAISALRQSDPTTKGAEHSDVSLRQALDVLDSVIETSLNANRSRISAAASTSNAEPLDVQSLERDVMHMILSREGQFKGVKSADALHLLRELIDSRVAAHAPQCEQLRSLRAAVWPEEESSTNDHDQADAVIKDGEFCDNDNPTRSDLLVFDTKPKISLKVDVKELMRKRIGLERLRIDKPATQVIGNTHILASAKHFDSVRCETLLAKACEGRHVRRSVSQSDNDAAIAEQWNLLSNLFNDESTVLLAHWHNHYALIYAMRAFFIVSEQKWERSMLTARKGQKPKEWMNFSEARRQMLRWKGHQIMALSSKNPSNLP